jgi:phosphoglycerate dehydrogenase-like enzyme
MKVYSLTKTLDHLVDFYSDDKENAEVLVVGGSKINLDEFPKLKYIFKCGVGVDNIPFDEIKERGVELVMPSDDTKEKIFDEVSSFTVNSILNAHYAGAGDMETWYKKPRQNIREKRLIVIGSKGNIGKRVVEKCKVFFDNILEYDVGDERDVYTMISESDIVTMHVPLTDTTKRIIDMVYLKEDVILVNNSRGALVDEEKLHKFLINNTEARATFDVFWEEPYAGKLLSLPNFIATPHIASSSDGFVKGLYRDLCNLVGR